MIESEPPEEPASPARENPPATAGSKSAALPVASYVKAYERDETLRAFCDEWLAAAQTGEIGVEQNVMLSQLNKVNPNAALMCAISLIELASEEVEDMILAGPIELILAKHGDSHIDVIGALTKQVPRLPRVLSYVWGDHIPQAVMRKIELFREA